ncbi:hypothetical protein NPIL_643981 [Nephila pilipes]|uniref:Uncharacterized protein n=1 Tax=Nephila pilipes TaxID=299642 RepID=A0A8X6USQ7_NEPPI|nr:hypothetical protein NPIL_643981 [Nephila pilipes]
MIAQDARRMTESDGPPQHNLHHEPDSADRTADLEPLIKSYLKVVNDNDVPQECDCLFSIYSNKRTIKSIRCFELLRGYLRVETSVQTLHNNVDNLGPDSTYNTATGLELHNSVRTTWRVSMDHKYLPGHKFL